MPPLVHQDLLPRDLDPKVDSTLAEINRRFRELYNALNVQAGFHGPVTFFNHINLNGNRIMNVGAPKNASDALSQTAADPLYSTPVQQAAMEAVGARMLQTTRRLNDGTQQHKISSDLNLQGSIPPILTGLTNFTSTSTTLTFTFPTSIQYGDQSIVAIPNVPLTVTGLTNSTAYKLYPYYDTVLGIGTFVADSVNAVGVPPIAFPPAASSTVLGNAAQLQNGDGRVALSSGAITATTGMSGGGGGSGGGCIRAGMVVETQERSIVPIEAVFVGDMIRARKGWTRVMARRSGTSAVFIRLETSNGEGVDVTPTHPICLFSGGEKDAGELTLGDVLCGAEGVPLQIMSLLTVEESGPIVLLSCNPTHEYLVGKFNPSIVAHNIIINK